MDAREQAKQLFLAGIAAVEPRAAVAKRFAVQRGVLEFAGERYRLAGFRRIFVIGAGKATAPMAQAVEEALGNRITDGVIVVKNGHTAPLKRVRCREASHPVPDRAGENGAAEIEALVSGLHATDLVIACWSGGASALLPAPREGISLADKQEVTRLLLSCGADIAAINTVRKHLSRLKGGQLARRAAPATVLNLVLSDVVGDDLSVIGSGPCTPDPTSWSDVLEIFKRFTLMDRLPIPVVDLLHAGLRAQAEDTPKPGDPCFATVRHDIVASNRIAIHAIAEACKRHGLAHLIIDRPITGEASAAAREFCSESMVSLGRPMCIIGGGETTVTISGKSGRGGRAQEFALAAAVALDGKTGITVLAGGTDGNDGPTDAAGAIADGFTVADAAAKNLPAARHLAEHDAYPLFAALGDLLMTGPTNTNVMDLYLALMS